MGGAGGNQQGVGMGSPWGVGPPSPFSCSRKCLCPCLGCPDWVKPSLTVTSPSFRSGPLYTPNQHPEAERPAQASEGKQSHPPHHTLPILRGAEGWGLSPPQVAAASWARQVGAGGLWVLPAPPLPCLLSQLGSEVSERPAPHPRNLTSPLPVTVWY